MAYKTFASWQWQHLSQPKSPNERCFIQKCLLEGCPSNINITSAITIEKFPSFRIQHLFIACFYCIRNQRCNSSSHALFPFLFTLLSVAENKRFVLPLCMKNYWQVLGCSLLPKWLEEFSKCHRFQLNSKMAWNLLQLSYMHLEIIWPYGFRFNIITYSFWKMWYLPFYQFSANMDHRSTFYILHPQKVIVDTCCLASYHLQYSLDSYIQYTGRSIVKNRLWRRTHLSFDVVMNTSLAVVYGLFNTRSPGDDDSVI